MKPCVVVLTPQIQPSTLTHMQPTSLPLVRREHCARAVRGYCELALQGAVVPLGPGLTVSGCLQGQSMECHGVAACSDQLLTPFVLNLPWALLRDVNYMRILRIGY